MPQLPEKGSLKAERILAAAGELLLSRGARGFTVADVAHRAHVGKGTVYLYWSSKEDLLIGLIGRDFLATADEMISSLGADPDLVRPSRLCPLLLTHATGDRFVRALQGRDELLGVVAEDPRSRQLLDTLGPMAMMNSVLPAWREHGLARIDWLFADQALALHALITGFGVVIGARSDRGGTGHRPGRGSAKDVGDHDHPDVYATCAAAVTALLGPEQAGPAEVEAAAAQHARVVADARHAVLELLGASEHSAQGASTAPI